MGMAVAGWKVRRATAVPGVVGHFEFWVAKTPHSNLLPRERALRSPGVGARKTPHRMPVGTPASASPPGEGEERTGLEGSWCFGVGARKTPHLLLAKSPAFSSPLGEGEAARPFEEIDIGRLSLGLCKGLRRGRKTTARLGVRRPIKATHYGSGFRPAWRVKRDYDGRGVCGLNGGPGAP